MRSLTIPSSDEALRALYRTEIAVSGRSKFEDTPQDRIISILSPSFLYAMDLGSET